MTKATKYLATAAVAALLAIAAPVNQAQAGEGSGFSLAGETIARSGVLPVAFYGFLGYLVYSHQVHKNGEMRASANDATFGGEERMAQSTATPAMTAVAINYNPQRDAITAQWAKIEARRAAEFAYAGK